MSNAVEHANQLAQNAMALKDQINSAKEPAKQTLEAANAYSNIADSVNAAIESSNAALAKADELTQVVRKHTLWPVNDVPEGSTEEARKVAKMGWISLQFSFVEYDGWFLGASQYFCISSTLKYV